MALAIAAHSPATVQLGSGNTYNIFDVTSTGTDKNTLTDLYDLIVTASGGSGVLSSYNITTSEDLNGTDGDTGYGERTYNITIGHLTARVIINVVADITEDRLGFTRFNLGRSSGGAILLQLFGSTVGTSVQNITIGANHNGILAGKVILNYDHDPADGLVCRANDNGIASSGGLQVDSNAQGAQKYFFFMGLPQAVNVTSTTVGWTANATTLTVTTPSATTFTSGKMYGFSLGDVVYYTDGSNITGTGTSRSLVASTLNNAQGIDLDTETAQSSLQLRLHPYVSMPDHTGNPALIYIMNGRNVSTSNRWDFDAYDGGATSMVGHVNYTVRDNSEDSGWNDDFGNQNHFNMRTYTVSSGLVIDSKDDNGMEINVGEFAPSQDLLYGSPTCRFPAIWGTRFNKTTQANVIQSYPGAGRSSRDSYILPAVPFDQISGVRIGYGEGTGAANHSILWLWEPGNTTPPNPNPRRGGHGFQNDGANFFYGLGYRPTLQTPAGVAYTRGSIISDRMYRNNSGTFTAPAVGTTNSDFDAPVIAATYDISSTTAWNNSSSSRDAFHIGRNADGNAKNYIASSDANNVFQHYAWEYNPSDNKNGYSLIFGVGTTTGNGGSGYTERAKYTGVFEVYHIVPGAETSILVKQPYKTSGGNAFDENNSRRDTVSLVARPGMTRNSNGFLTNDLGVAFESGASIGANGFLVNTQWDTFTLRSAATTGDQLVDTYAGIPDRVVNTYSNKSFADRNTDFNEYMNYASTNQVGHTQHIIRYRGDLIVSTNASGRAVLKGLAAAAQGSGFPARNETTIALTTIPTKTASGSFDTLALGTGEFTYAGKWQLPSTNNASSRQINCTGNTGHCYIQGVIHRPLTHTSYANALATRSFIAHDRMDGEISIDGSGSDQYIAFSDNCSIRGGGGLDITKEGSGAGQIYVINAPAGTEVGTGVTLVNTLSVRRPAMAGESSTSNHRGRLSIVTSAGVEIASSSTSGALSYASGFYTYSFDSTTTAALTAAADGTDYTLVWSGAGAQDIRVGFTLERGTNSLTDLTVTSQTRASATAYTGNATYTPQTFVSSQINRSGGYQSSSNPTTLVVDSTSGFPTYGQLVIGGNRITYTNTTATTFTGIPASGVGSVTEDISDDDAVYGPLVVRVAGNEVPSIDEMILLADTSIRSTAQYNRLVAYSSAHINAVSNDNGEYTQINGDYVTLETNDAETKTLPYIFNTSTQDPKTPVTQSRTISGTGYATNIVGSAPVISAALFRDLGVATTSDVNNARNVILGNL